MVARLRALERKYTRERATLAVRDFAERVSARWHRIVEQPGNPQDVAQDIIRDNWDWTVGVPTLTHAYTLLKSHLSDGARPSEGAIITTMAPWSVRRPSQWK